MHTAEKVVFSCLPAVCVSARWSITEQHESSNTISNLLQID